MGKSASSPAKKSRRIGILGGSFNPVHLGHLALARRAKACYRLDKVLFIPCAKAPHAKSEQPGDALMRLGMLRVAVRGEAGFRVSGMEIRRGGISYSYDTLRILRRRAKPGTRFFFLIGSDNLRKISAWYRAEDLMKMCTFVAMARSPRRGKRPGLRVLPSLRPHARVLKGHGFAISSEDIRARVREGLPIKGMVPAGVEAWIKKNRLYRRG